MDLLVDLQRIERELLKRGIRYPGDWIEPDEAEIRQSAGTARTVLAWLVQRETGHPSIERQIYALRLVRTATRIAAVLSTLPDSDMPTYEGARKWVLQAARHALRIGLVPLLDRK